MGRYLRFGNPEKVAGGKSVVHDPAFYAQEDEYFHDPSDDRGRLHQQHEAGISAYPVVAEDAQSVTFKPLVEPSAFIRQANGFLLDRVVAQEVYSFSAEQTMKKRGWSLDDQENYDSGYYEDDEIPDRNEMILAVGYDNEPLLDSSTVSDVKKETREIYALLDGERKRLLDLVKPKELYWKHDMGATEFFDENVTSEDVNAHFDALRKVFVTPEQVGVLEEFRSMWLEELESAVVEAFARIITPERKLKSEAVETDFAVVYETIWEEDEYGNKEISVHAVVADEIIGYSYGYFGDRYSMGDKFDEDLPHLSEWCDNADIGIMGYVGSAEVEEAFLGAGIGVTLLESLIEELDNQSPDVLLLDVMPSKWMDVNRWKSRLRRMGFRDIGNFSMVRTSIRLEELESTVVEAFIRIVISEKMVRENYDNYARLVTAAYAARPVLESEAVGMWKSLAAHNGKMMKKVRSRIDVEYVDNYDDIGYQTADEMTRRVKEDGKMIVDTRFSDHQVWTKEQNWEFRAVHDYIVHIGGGHPFGLKGELASYNLHSKLVPHGIRPAIFSEVVGQVCTEIVTGGFPDPQKVCILHGFDYVKVGTVDPTGYRDNFESEEQMRELLAKFGAKAEWDEDGH